MKLPITFTDSDRGIQYEGTVSGSFAKGCKQTWTEPGEPDRFEVDGLEIDSVVIAGNTSRGSKYGQKSKPDTADEFYRGWCGEILDDNSEAIERAALEALGEEYAAARERNAEERAEMLRDRSILG